MNPFAYTRRALALFIPVLFFGATPGIAQIVIPDAYVTGMIGQTARMVVYETSGGAGLDALVQDIGEDRTWDFNLNWTDSTVFIQRTLPFTGTTPGAGTPEFATADHVVENVAPPVTGGPPDTARVWIYRQLSNGVLMTLGQASEADLDGDGTPEVFVQYNDPPSVQIVFPVSYQDEWSDSTGVVSNFGGQMMVTAINTYTRTVNGWGTVNTQFASGPVLRSDKVERLTNPFTGMTEQDQDLEFIGLGGFSTEIDFNEDGSPRKAFLTLNRNFVGGGDPTPIETDLPDAAGLTLSPNYPNPFIGSTTLSYALPRAGDVDVAVYNTLGQRIETLVQARRPAGTHDLTWNGGHLVPGTYFVRLQYDHQFILTRGMVRAR